MWLNVSMNDICRVNIVDRAERIVQDGCDVLLRYGRAGLHFKNLLEVMLNVIHDYEELIKRFLRSCN